MSNEALDLVASTRGGSGDLCRRPYTRDGYTEDHSRLSGSRCLRGHAEFPVPDHGFPKDLLGFSPGIRANHHATANPDDSRRVAVERDQQKEPQACAAHGRRSPTRLCWSLGVELCLLFRSSNRDFSGGVRLFFHCGSPTHEKLGCLAGLSRTELIRRDCCGMIATALLDEVVRCQLSARAHHARSAVEGSRR